MRPAGHRASTPRSGCTHLASPSITAMSPRKPHAKFIACATLLAAIAAAIPSAAEEAGTALRTTPLRPTKNFHFNNIEVRAALQLLADEGQFNLVVSDSVKGTITLHLNGVTWEQALDTVLMTKGL